MGSLFQLLSSRTIQHRVSTTEESVPPSNITISYLWLTFWANPKFLGFKFAELKWLMSSREALSHDGNKREVAQNGSGRH